ncbi:hypothetical protein K438DRAFT_1775123 [Mycena galopus ATCC 62051]|nr:hypothetical protein K438DRAFT_1775123 [Mycena galopus ATCC 62051]
MNVYNPHSIFPGIMVRMLLVPYQFAVENKAEASVIGKWRLSLPKLEITKRGIDKAAESLLVQVLGFRQFEREQGLHVVVKGGDMVDCTRAVFYGRQNTGTRSHCLIITLPEFTSTTGSEQHWGPPKGYRDGRTSKRGGATVRNREESKPQSSLAETPTPPSFANVFVTALPARRTLLKNKRLLQSVKKNRSAANHSLRYCSLPPLFRPELSLSFPEQMDPITPSKDNDPRTLFDDDKPNDTPNPTVATPNGEFTPDGHSTPYDSPVCDAANRKTPDSVDSYRVHSDFVDQGEFFHDQILPGDDPSLRLQLPSFAVDGELAHGYADMSGILSAFEDDTFEDEERDELSSSLPCTPHAPPALEGLRLPLPLQPRQPRQPLADPFQVDHGPSGGLVDYPSSDDDQELDDEVRPGLEQVGGGSTWREATPPKEQAAVRLRPTVCPTERASPSAHLAVKRRCLTVPAKTDSVLPPNSMPPPPEDTAPVQPLPRPPLAPPHAYAPVPPHTTKGVALPPLPRAPHRRVQFAGEAPPALETFSGTLEDFTALGGFEPFPLPPPPAHYTGPGNACAAAASGGSAAGNARAPATGSARGAAAPADGNSAAASGKARAAAASADSHRAAASGTVHGVDASGDSNPTSAASAPPARGRFSARQMKALNVCFATIDDLVAACADATNLTVERVFNAYLRQLNNLTVKVRGDNSWNKYQLFSNSSRSQRINELRRIDPDFSVADDEPVPNLSNEHLVAAYELFKQAYPKDRMDEILDTALELVKNEHEQSQSLRQRQSTFTQDKKQLENKANKLREQHGFEFFDAELGAIVKTEGMASFVEDLSSCDNDLIAAAKLTAYQYMMKDVQVVNIPPAKTIASARVALSPPPTLPLPPPLPAAGPSKRLAPIADTAKAKAKERSSDHQANIKVLRSRIGDTCMADIGVNLFSKSNENFVCQGIAQLLAERNIILLNSPADARLFHLYPNTKGTGAFRKPEVVSINNAIDARSVPGAGDFVIFTHDYRLPAPSSPSTSSASLAHWRMSGGVLWPCTNGENDTFEVDYDIRPSSKRRIKSIGDAVDANTSKRFAAPRPKRTRVKKEVKSVVKGKGKCKAEEDDNYDTPTDDEPEEEEPMSPPPPKKPQSRAAPKTGASSSLSLPLPAQEAPVMPMTGASSSMPPPPPAQEGGGRRSYAPTRQVDNASDLSDNEPLGGSKSRRRTEALLAPKAKRTRVNPPSPRLLLDYVDVPPSPHRQHGPSQQRQQHPPQQQGRPQQQQDRPRPKPLTKHAREPSGTGHPTRLSSPSDDDTSPARTWFFKDLAGTSSKPRASASGSGEAATSSKSMVNRAPAPPPAERRPQPGKSVGTSFMGSKPRLSEPPIATLDVGGSGASGSIARHAPMGGQPGSVMQPPVCPLLAPPPRSAAAPQLPARSAAASHPPAMQPPAPPPAQSALSPAVVAAMGTLTPLQMQEMFAAMLAQARLQ